MKLARGAVGSAPAHCVTTTMTFHAAMSHSRRAMSSSVGASEPSPVNVEEFTLNDEVVQKHMAIAERWRTLDEELQQHRSSRNFESILVTVDNGLALLEEVGPMNAPVQCETNLLLESAQAHFNLQHPGPALLQLQRARGTLKASKDCDASKVAEIDEFIGHVLLLKGDAVDAEKTFRAVLQWIDTDAKKAMPMVAVAAVNQRRSVLGGIGLALKLQGEQEVVTGGDARALFGQALDTLIDALNLHIEANDFVSVKDTLRAVVRCFVGVNDAPQALKTVQRFMSWCSRHQDYDGVLQGADMITSMCAANSALENPLESDEGLKLMVATARNPPPPASPTTGSAETAAVDGSSAPSPSNSAA